jgi:hypothetical protein
MRDFLLISDLLNSNISSSKQGKLHLKDLYATWFTVPYYTTNSSLPQLYTYSRLQDILDKHGPDRNQVKNQYPSLVSFFGDSGGGKSTLIRALIRLAAPGDFGYSVPVPGNQVDIHKSTSGGVHLYADPNTISTEAPLFFAGEHLTHL